MAHEWPKGMDTLADIVIVPLLPFAHVYFTVTDAIDEREKVKARLKDLLDTEYLQRPAPEYVEPRAIALPSLQLDCE